LQKRGFQVESRADLRMLADMTTVLKRLWLVPLLLLGACREEVPSSAPPPANSAASTPAATAPPGPAASAGSAIPPIAATGQPQPKLPVLKLWIGTNQVSAEVAASIPQIRTGMMWRTNMAEMEGMLFVFPVAQEVAFYMRNTLLPLTCAYIDPQGSILEIYDMKPRDETPIPSASDQIQYVLEMNQGWFERHGVKPGMLVSSEQGALSQLFFRRAAP